LIAVVGLLVALQSSTRTFASDSYTPTSLHLFAAPADVATLNISDNQVNPNTPTQETYQVVVTLLRDNVADQIGICRPTTPTETNYADRTDDNRVYQNDIYGYSLVVAPGWTVVEHAPYYIRLVQGSYKIDAPVSETYLSILAMDNSNHMPLEEWTEEYVRFSSAPTFISLGGVRSAQWMTTNTDKNANSFSYTPNGSIVYQMALVTMGDTSEPANLDLDAMQSSFRITKVISDKVESSSITAYSPSLNRNLGLLSYNRQAARDYATSYCSRTCDDGVSFASCGGDCAHFVSHGLKAGGLDNSSTSRYCCNGGCCNLSVNSAAMWNWFLNTGNGASQSSVSGLDVGDVIFYSWDGGPIWDHVTMVIEDNGGSDIYVASHTRNECRYYWTFGGAGKYGFMHVNGGGSTDTTKPDGDITSPSEGATITSRTVRLSGWASDGGSGVDRAHFTASAPNWHAVGPDFNTSSFNYDWDLCADNVPDGQVTLGLDIWDKAGNEANTPRGNRHFTKSYNCNPTPPPSANFDAWPQSGAAPLVVAMHIVNTANITSCSWDYGDGQTGSSCASSHDHTYNSAGSFTVRLTVNGPGGADTQTRTNYITVNTPADTTKPDGDITSPSEGATITSRTVQLAGWASDGGSGVDRAHFTASAPNWHAVGPDFNTSSFDYDWDMCADGVPDGQITLGLDIWDKAGNEANSPRGNRHFTKNYNCSPPPSAQFDAWPQSGVAPLTVAMHIVSTANISSCLWDYGDGQTGTSCNSSHDHTYTSPGTYTVRLTVNGPGGADTQSRSDYITVSGPSLSASWSSPSNGQTITARAVGLSANVSGGSGGINRIAFSAAYGGSWHGVHTDYSAPYAIDWDLCAAGVPDGDIELGLEAWDNAGNHYVYSEHYANFHVTKSYNCTPAPSAQFDAWPQSGTAPLTVAMHIVSTANMTNCSWDYGDGQTGTSCASSHDHTYSSAGSFTVKLNVSGPGGSDSMTRTGYISVTSAPTHTATPTLTRTPTATPTPTGTPDSVLPTIHWIAPVGDGQTYTAASGIVGSLQIGGKSEWTLTAIKG
jgi:PKD repeat protein